MNGFECLREGFALVSKPGVRRYVIVPTLINTIVLIGLVSFSVREFDGWVGAIVALLPNWLSFLSWLVEFIGFIVVAFSLLPSEENSASCRYGRSSSPTREYD